LVIPRHPRANGQVERFFRTLRASLGAIVQELGPEGHDCWDEYLVHVAYAYNTSVHATVGDTPFYLFYGRDPAQNAPFTLDEDLDLLTQSREDAIRHAEAARWTAIQKANEAAYKNRLYYNQRANPQTINVGDKVFVECPTPPHAPNPKLLRKYDGPYIVHEVGIHKITLRTHCGLYQKEVHRDKLRPSFEPEGPYEDEPDDDDDDATTTTTTPTTTLDDPKGPKALPTLTPWKVLRDHARESLPRDPPGHRTHSRPKAAFLRPLRHYAGITSYRAPQGNLGVLLRSKTSPSLLTILIWRQMRTRTLMTHVHRRSTACSVLRPR
jgi:hypothetical protein